MTTGIALEKDINRPFAVSLANGLPEEIRRDDVKALREEYELYMAADAIEFTGEKRVCFKKAMATLEEIEKRIAQAQAAGFDTKGW